MFRHSGPAVLMLALVLAGCSSDPDPDPPPADTQVRVSVVDGHDVVVSQRVGSGPWSDPARVLTLDDRECGAAESTSSQGLVAVTVECDDTYYADQAPTRSVALVGKVGSDWSHHDLEGEAYGAPAVSPSGSYALWSQGDGLLRWSSDAGFETVDAPTAQALSIDDDGSVLTADLVAGDRAGIALRITDGSDTQDVDLPAGPGGSDGEYDAVWFRSAEEIVVRSALGNVVVGLDGDRWEVQE